MNILKRVLGEKKVEEEIIDLIPAEKHLIYMCAKFGELINKKMAILILREYREKVMKGYDESIFETPYLKYVRELDNPVPDINYRIFLKEQVIRDYEEAGDEAE